MGFAVALSLGPTGARGLPAAAPACQGEERADVVSGLSRHGDLQLSSGALVRLPGIRLPDEASLRESALAWLRERIGQPVIVRALGDSDRWARVPAAIALTRGGDPPSDLSQGLVAAGLALTEPGGATPFCQPQLLALEKAARERGLGLWAGDRYKPVDALEIERLREKTGTFVLVEGRVRSVGERQQQTYLNFGGTWTEDFTIIIPKKVWASMAEAGLTAKALKGSRIRARGILEDWQGTALTVSTPETIELITDEGPRY